MSLLHSLLLIHLIILSKNFEWKKENNKEKNKSVPKSMSYNKFIKKKIKKDIDFLFSNLFILSFSPLFI